MLDQYSPRVLASVHKHNQRRGGPHIHWTCFGSGILATHVQTIHVTSRWLSLNDWRRKNTLKLEWVQMKIWLLGIKRPQSKWSGSRTRFDSPFFPLSLSVIGMPIKISQHEKHPFYWLSEYISGLTHRLPQQKYHVINVLRSFNSISADVPDATPPRQMG